MYQPTNRNLMKLSV